MTAETLLELYVVRDRNSLLKIKPVMELYISTCVDLKRFAYNEGSLQKTLTEISIPDKLTFKKHQIEHPGV